MKKRSKSKLPRLFSHRLLVLCAATVALHEAAMAGEIKVIAYIAESDKGQSGVLVQLEACGHDAKSKVTHTTGPDGVCVFSNLSPGTYCLTFNKTNYTIIVPSTTHKLAAAASSATEEVRTYRDGSLVSPNSVIAFLQHRAAGDSTRYSADVEALRTGHQLDPAKLTLVAQGNAAQSGTQVTTTTTTTTDTKGTITEYTPGSAIVLRETSGPRHYRFGKSVTYVTRSGKVLDEDVVKTRVKVGVPVRVHYIGTGDNVMVDRVILDED